MAFQSAEIRILRWIAAGLPDLAKGTELIAARKAASEKAASKNISNRSMEGSGQLLSSMSPKARTYAARIWAKRLQRGQAGRQDFARYDAIVACADDSLDLDSLAVSESGFCRGCKSTQSSKQCIPPLLGRGAGCMRAKRMLFMLSSLGV